MEKIAIYNNKGGVGKSTIAANLSHGLAELELNTLLIDLDEQRDSEFLLGFDDEDIENTIYHLYNDSNLNDCIYKAREGLDLLSNSNMEQLEESWMNENLENLLSNLLKKLYDVDYDYVIIDCSPSKRSKINHAILHYVDHILVPIQTEIMSVKNIKNIYQKLTELNISHEKVKMIIPNMHDKRTNMSKNNLSNIKEFFNDENEIVTPPINRRVAIAEAGEKGKSVFEHDNKGAVQFYDVLEQVVMNLG